MNEYQEEMTPEQRRADNASFSYKVTERIAVLGRYGNVTKELNKVSYRGKPAKYDIRSWEHIGFDSKLGKGVTLTDSEMEALRKAILGKV